jgi:uncharacterized protein (DUF1778 family)
MNASVRPQRIDLRTSNEIKTFIGLAAQRKKMSISAYLLESAMLRAREEIDSPDKVRLQNTDWVTFYSAIDNPPEPNAALRNLFAKY